MSEDKQSALEAFVLAQAKQYAGVYDSSNCEVAREAARQVVAAFAPPPQPKPATAARCIEDALGLIGENDHKDMRLYAREHLKSALTLIRAQDERVARAVACGRGVSGNRWPNIMADILEGK